MRCNKYLRRHYHIRSFPEMICFHSLKKKKQYYKKYFDPNYKKYYPERNLRLLLDVYSCRNCGSNKNVVVHHIDQSRKLGIKKMNNELKNLISLCKSCHGIVHSYA